MAGFGTIGKVVALVWASPRTSALVKHMVASVREGLMALSELSGGVADEFERRGEPSASSVTHLLRVCENTSRGVATHLHEDEQGGARHGVASPPQTNAAVDCQFDHEPLGAMSNTRVDVLSDPMGSIQ